MFGEERVPQEYKTKSQEGLDIVPVLLCQVQLSALSITDPIIHTNFE